jgi:23S rRNA pseudouridine1911/1915/1917 synthase
MTIKTVSGTAQNEGRVDLVVQQLCQATRSQIRGMFDHECVSINNQSCVNPGASVALGDVISVRYEVERRYREKKKQWEDRTFAIVYEDDDLIVVDKTAGTLTVPSDDNNEVNTLVQRVSHYLNHSKRSRHAWVVHRLDREVSGLLIFGKTEAIAGALIQQFKDQKLKRLYAAIVTGLMQQKQGTLKAHLGTGKNLDRYVTRESKDTELAITHFRVQERLKDTTVVEVELETGKRNQIRVQFADIGHPILGDPRYKKQEASHPGWIRKRIALHARSLCFVHPVTGKKLELDSPLPPALAKFIAGNRGAHKHTANKS